MSSDQFERKLQERFAQAEIQPSAALWDRIEADLAPPANKKRFLWLWWPLVGLLLLSVGLAWVWSPGEEAATMLPTTSLPSQPQTEQADFVEIPNDAMQQSPSAPQAMTSDTGASGSSSPDQPVLRSETTNSPLPSTPVSQPTESEPVFVETSSSAIQVDLPPSSEPEMEISQSPLPSWMIDQEVGLRAYQLQQDLAALSPSLLSTSWPQAFSDTWTLDLSLKSGYALGLSSSVRVSEENSLSADYAGLANRSSYSGLPSGQVATVLFPRIHHSVSVEAGRLIGTRWRLSMGLEGKVGLSGKTGLGEFDESYSTPPPTGAIDLEDALIVVEENSVNFSEPREFDHYTLSLPLRISYLAPLGRGKMEYSAGLSLNRSWTYIASQSLLESFAFQLNSEAIATSESLAVPNPVLQTNNWHSDLRLRGRYVFASQQRFQPFIGAELQTQLQPAFSGDASINQRPFLIGVELGIRFR